MEVESMKASKNLQNNITKLSKSLKEKDKVVLDLDLFETMIIRLETLAGKCQECRSLLDEAQPHFKDLADNNGIADRDMRKRQDNLRERMVKHLRKSHGLYRAGHFMSIYLPLGISIGVTLGLVYSRLLYYSVAGAAFGYLIGLLVDSFVMKKKSRI
jgi:hypothetical protein